VAVVTAPDRPTPGTRPEIDARIVDPRAVRVALAPSSAHAAIAAIMLEPPEIPLAPAQRVGGAGVLGGAAARAPAFDAGPRRDDGVVLVDSLPVHVRLDRFDAVHAVLVEGSDDDVRRTPVLLLPLEGTAGPSSGVLRREVIVDGWRIEVEIESERRASLRERARRGREETAHGGPTHVRAIIPGRIVSVSIVPGDPVVAGQQLLVVEAMKMQNELRAPRDGIVSSVAVGAGGTIEVGDLLLVLE
jgi:biotin carboxyl carrier protein